MSAKVTFPVTITGMNITDRGVAGKYGPQDKAGLTIQQTNVIDEAGQNVVIPEGAWLNGFAPQGALDAVSVGSTIELQIRTKPNPTGGFYYNFGYYPKNAAPAAPAAPAAAPAPAAPAGPSLADFEALVERVSEIEKEMDF